ncbi:MAG: HAD family hydrolase [Acidobacteriota bacterium]
METLQDGTRRSLRRLGITDLRAVLYDLDGVLIHSAPAWYEVVKRAARHFDCPPVAPDLFRETFGQGLEADARVLFPGRTPREISDFYEEAFPREIPSVELGRGALQALAAVRARGLRQAVVTNSPRELAQKILDQKGITRYVDAAVGAGDAPEKPAPDLVRLALARLGVGAEQALYVGDSPADAEACRAAGVKMAGLGVRADLAIGSLLEIPDIIL